MQTAIHFEGDLAYICVSDQGEIKEENLSLMADPEWNLSFRQHRHKGRNDRSCLMKQRRRSYNKQKNSVSVQESQRKVRVFYQSKKQRWELLDSVEIICCVEIQ